MNRRTCLLSALIATAAVGLTAQTPPAPAAPATGSQGQRGGRGPAVPGLTLTSPAFVDGGEMPARHSSADSSGISPRLEWTNVPANTVSFVLILHDPDVAPQGKVDDVLQWLVFNIPGTARELPEGLPPTATLPDGTIQGKHLRGGVGYLGPGGLARPYHHYLFDLFAVDLKLDLGPDATRAQILQAIDGHIVGKAVLVGKFHR